MRPRRGVCCPKSWTLGRTPGCGLNSIVSDTRRVAPTPNVLCWVTALAFAFLTRTVSAGPILDHETKVWSQGNEELVIRDYFKDARDGFFLDVGCAFPRRYSTTFYLEKRLGWSGIGIDAVAKYAPAWKKLRPRSKFFNYLVTDHSGTNDTFYQSRYSPISSVHRDLVDHDEYEEIQVESVTLNDLLEREGVEKVDFVSLDIEGAGLLALRGFDIERYKPELVCTEPIEDQMALLAYFKERGYRWRRDFLKYDFGNWYFEPVDRPLLTAGSFDTWTQSGDDRIRFVMDGRNLVARMPPEVPPGAVALFCSPDGFDGFHLQLEIQPSTPGMASGVVVRGFDHGWRDAFRVDADAPTPSRWTRLEVHSTESQARATGDEATVLATRVADAPEASVCLRVGSGDSAQGTERELRWRHLRIGPHEAG